MDEPAAGLDPRARIELRNLLKVLSEQGKAILISSHILTELAEICNGAVFIERGRILKAGMLEDLMRESTPHRLVFLRSLRPAEQLHRQLLQMPGVESARLKENGVEAELAGGDEECCNLLAALIAAGFPMLEFTPQGADLEEIFMTV